MEYLDILINAQCSSLLLRVVTSDSSWSSSWLSYCALRCSSNIFTSEMSRASAVSKTEQKDGYQ